VVLLAVTYVLLNFLADAFVLWIDPRVRTGRL
jgi:ABC-type dipeptide/oligopeptide/nickel transport system permease component